MYGNCAVCDRFTTLNRFKMCERCFIEDEAFLSAAREFVDKEGSQSVEHLAEMLSIEPERIIRWIDQKRIDIETLEYRCPKCGDDLFQGMCTCQMEHFLVRTPEESNENGKKESKGFHSSRRVEEKCRQYWETKTKIRRKQKRDIWVPS